MWTVDVNYINKINANYKKKNGQSSFIQYKCIEYVICNLSQKQNRNQSI